MVISREEKEVKDTKGTSEKKLDKDRNMDIAIQIKVVVFACVSSLPTHFLFPRYSIPSPNATACLPYILPHILFPPHKANSER